MAEQEVFDLSSDSEDEVGEEESENESVDSGSSGFEDVVNAFNVQIHNLLAEIGQLHMKIRGLEDERSQLVNDKIGYWTQVMDLRAENRGKDETIYLLRQEIANLQVQVAQQQQPNNEPVAQPNQGEVVEEIAVAAPPNEDGAQAAVPRRGRKKRGIKLIRKSQRGNYPPVRVTRSGQSAKAIPKKKIFEKQSAQPATQRQMEAPIQNEARDAEVDGNRRENSETPPHHEVASSALFSCACGKKFKKDMALKAHIRMHRILHKRGSTLS